MKIGFVGAGRMGLPMVRRLSAAGEYVSVLVRSSDGGAAVRGLPGVAAVSEIGAVARDADAIVVCVHKDSEVLQVCTEAGLLDAIAAGAVLIVHTTGSPFTVQRLADLGRARGVLVADAPVSGGPDDIDRGEITVFLGGSDEAAAKATPVLAAYADPLVHVGPLGGGQLVKLVNNSIFLANIEVLVAAIGFGESQGLDVATLVSCLQRGSASSRALDGVARAGSPVAFRRNVSEFLEKDAAVVREVAEAVGADLGAISQLLAARSPQLPDR